MLCHWNPLPFELLLSLVDPRDHNKKRYYSLSSLSSCKTYWWIAFWLEPAIPWMYVHVLMLIGCNEQKITLYLCVQPVGLICLSFIFSVSCPSMQTAWHHWSLSRLNLSMFELRQNRSVDHVSVSVFIISASPSLMDFHYSYICMTEALYQQHIHIWLGGSE